MDLEGLLGRDRIEARKHIREQVGKAGTVIADTSWIVGITEYDSSLYPTEIPAYRKRDLPQRLNNILGWQSEIYDVLVSEEVTIPSGVARELRGIIRHMGMPTDTHIPQNEPEVLRAYYRDSALNMLTAVNQLEKRGLVIDMYPHRADVEYVRNHSPWDLNGADPEVEVLLSQAKSRKAVLLCNDGNLIRDTAVNMLGKRPHVTVLPEEKNYAPRTLEEMATLIDRREASWQSRQARHGAAYRIADLSWQTKA